MNVSEYRKVCMKLAQNHFSEMVVDFCLAFHAEFLCDLAFFLIFRS